MEGGGVEQMVMRACLRRASRAIPVLAAAKVSLVHPGKDVLPEIQDSSPRLHRYAVRTLAELGVLCRNNSRVSELKATKLHFEDGTSVSVGRVLYAIGQQRVALSGLSGLALDAQGKLIADAQLRADGHQNVWVGGDCASVRRPFMNGTTCRQDALWAVKHGTRIGKNLARVTRGRSAHRFRFPGLGQAAGLGRGRGVLEIYGLQFTGPLAYALRAGFFLYFYPSARRVPALLAQLIWGQQKQPNAHQGALNPLKEATV